MTEHKDYTHADPCEWEGKPTTIGEVYRRYKGSPYQSLVCRGIANAGVKSHADLLKYDMACVARRKNGGRANAKRNPWRLNKESAL